MDGPNSLIGFNSRGGSDLIGHNKWGDFRFVARPRSRFRGPTPDPDRVETTQSIFIAKGRTR